jgi:hypothetical protein
MDSFYWLRRYSVARMMARHATMAEEWLIHFEVAGRMVASRGEVVAIRPLRRPRKDLG